MVALVAGRAVPAGRKFGHAGAIIRDSGGTAEAKIERLTQAGARIAPSPREIPGLVREVL